MPQPPTQPLRIIRYLLPYTTVAAVLALVYVGWVFFARSQQNQALQHEADEKALEQARRTDQLYGSEQLKILLFYASPRAVARGQATQLCYGVANATTVTMTPPVEGFKPSLNRCVEVKPARTTTYTLTAADDKGHSATESVNVTVR